MFVLYGLGIFACLPIIVNIIYVIVRSIIVAIMYGLSSIIYLSTKNGTFNIVNFIISIPISLIVNCVFVMLLSLFVYLLFIPKTLKQQYHNLKMILSNEMISGMQLDPYLPPKTCLSKEIENYHSFWKAFLHMCRKCDWDNVGNGFCI